MNNEDALAELVRKWKNKAKQYKIMLEEINSLCNTDDYNSVEKIAYIQDVLREGG